MLSRLNKIVPVFFLCVWSLGVLAAEKEFTTALTGKFPPFSYYDNSGKLTLTYRAR
jgi:hypothetical protein